MVEKFEGKSILVLMPRDFGIYKVIESNIGKFGFSNYRVVAPERFRYKSISDRVYNFIRKTFFRDKEYKKKLASEFKSDYYNKVVSQYKKGEIDFVLIIRPDVIMEETLVKIKEISKKMVGYQWDGLDRFGEVFYKIKYFDKFFVFDKNDYEKYCGKFPNLHLTTNFFFDYPHYELGKEKNNGKVYYVGSYIKDRLEDILYVVDLLEKKSIPMDINLFCTRTLKIKNECIKPIGEMSFTENLSRIQNCDVLLDFKAREHNGLSLRFFESMKYKKKIITNNKHVADYDFYRKENIFILYQDNNEQILDFVNSNYMDIPEEIVRKYSFSYFLEKCFQ